MYVFCNQITCVAGVEKTKRGGDSFTIGISEDWNGMPRLDRTQLRQAIQRNKQMLK